MTDEEMELRVRMAEDEARDAARALDMVQLENDRLREQVAVMQGRLRELELSWWRRLWRWLTRR